MLLRLCTLSLCICAFSFVVVYGVPTYRMDKPGFLSCCAQHVYYIRNYAVTHTENEYHLYLQEKEEAMGVKGRAREKARPKRGKMEIDYQKLHDAFFVYVVS